MRLVSKKNIVVLMIWCVGSKICFSGFGWVKLTCKWVGVLVLVINPEKMAQAKEIESQQSSHYVSPR